MMGMIDLEEVDEEEDERLLLWGLAGTEEWGGD